METSSPPNDRPIDVVRNENKLSNKLDQPSKTVDYADEQVKGTFHESSAKNKESVETWPPNKLRQAPKKLDAVEVKQASGALPDGFFDNKERSESMKVNQFHEPSKKLDFESKQVKGALPEGFFDNKDADLRARGIEPVKVDIK